jgi:excisionase family DNA binding protein
MENVVTLTDLANKIELLASAVMTNKPVLNIPEASIYTGLAESYLYKLTSTQEIPHFKPRGKMIYFNRVELDNWLQQNRIKSNSEIQLAVLNHIDSGTA